MDDQLSPKQRAFAEQYLRDLNATQAAIRAGYSPNSATQQGSQMLATPHIRAHIDVLMAERSKRVEIDNDDVLRELWNIATADANDLIEHRRNACRFCWGDEHKYQRTPAEYERDLADYQRAFQTRAKDDESPITPFNELGGVGYNPRREPHAECPECFGDGYGEVFVKDSRFLTGDARTLYAGVKQTKDGIEIKIHPKDKALELLGRHLGLFHDKIDVTVHDTAQRILEARKRARGR